MTEQVKENMDASKVVGMMLRKRVKEGKKYVNRMVYVENPTQSKDPLHNSKRSAKRDAALRAKEQKSNALKEIKKQMEVFDMRFILARMNKFAPDGYCFITVGKDNKIALYSRDIMGTQKPNGAFVSDISFDLIFGLYADLFNGKKIGPNDELYENIRFFGFDKPDGLAPEQHKKYINVIEKIALWDIGMLPPLTLKKVPTRNFFDKNAVLVQGIMDSGQMPPKYLNNRMHKIVNEMVWWSFRRVLIGLKYSRLQQLRKAYRAHLSGCGVVPGYKFGGVAAKATSDFANNRQSDLEAYLDKLINIDLPMAKRLAQDDFVSLCDQSAQYLGLQMSKSANVSTCGANDGIKMSKKMKTQIAHEIDELCSGRAQKKEVERIQKEIRKVIHVINGVPKVIEKPARKLMPNVFYKDPSTQDIRKIGKETSLMSQLKWLVCGKIQKVK